MIRQLFLLVVLAIPGMASALDYKSLNDNAIVYDAGSNKAKPLFILLKGTPVEVIVNVDKWVKIRELSGGMGWVERGALGDTRQVIVTVSSTDVRQRAEEAAPLVFSAAKDVVLEVLEKPTGAWVKVKHRDGQSGYVPIKSVWGI